MHLSLLLSSRIPAVSCLRLPFPTSRRFLMSAAAPSKFTLALCQFASGADKLANLEVAREAVAGAAARGAAVIVLPECFNSPYATDKFPVYAETIPGDVTEASASENPTTHFLHGLAKKHGVYLIGGSFPERDGAHLYNTCLAFDPAGTLLAKYRKMHLFDIDVPGGITFKESDTLSAGNELAVFDTIYGRIGLGICYDLRFAHLSLIMAAQGCKLLAFPGAFNTVTGPSHWELLLRSRALDNQVFVAACSPSRGPGPGYQAWGHSSIVNPWGEVIATTSHHATNVYADIDMALVDSTRAQIPVTSQRRAELYELAWTGGKL